MEHAEYTYTFGMEEREVEERLRAGRVGVLALADRGDAYAVPVAYHYDGDLHLRLGDHEASEKMAYVDTTTTASFVVHGATGPEASWSIVIRGSLHRLPDDRFDEAAINERFGPIRVFGEDVGDMEQAIYEVDIEEITGRATD